MSPRVGVTLSARYRLQRLIDELIAQLAILPVPWGVRAGLGARGIEEIVELDLTADERAALDESAAAVRDVVSVLTA